MKQKSDAQFLDDASVHFSEYIYPKAVTPVINAVLKNIDDAFKLETDFSFFMKEKEYEIELSKVYEEKRDWLKRIYFCENRFHSTQQPLLDMHKIAAVICRSIIKMKPFSFDIKKANDFIVKANKQEELDWLINNYLINYKVAFDSAMVLNLYDIINRLPSVDFQKSDNLKDTKEIKENFLTHLAKKGFYYYKDIPFGIPYSHESYYKSSIINLAINDINKRDFDYLGFATNCFQIQINTVYSYFLNVN